MNQDQVSHPSSLQVSVVQTRYDRGLEENVASAVDSIAAAGHAGSDVVLFPEANLTSYDFGYASALAPEAVSAGLEAVGAACKKYRLYGIVGTLQRRSEEARLLNIAHIFNRSGILVYEYAKLHLGGSAELASCRRGKKVALFDIDGVPASVIICRDGRHPELSVLAAMAGAQMLFQLSNSCDTIEKSWWKDKAGRSSQPVSPRSAMFHFCANGIGQSRDGNMLTLGGSFILDATGLPLAEAGPYEETLLTARIVPERATLRFPIDGMAHPELLAEDWERMVDKIVEHKDDPVQ